MINIKFFGKFRLLVDSEKTTLSELQRSLLLCLVFSGDQGITDKQIADRCDCEPSSINGAIRKIRLTLEPGLDEARNSSYLIKDESRYFLKLKHADDVDTLAFKECLAQADEAKHLYEAAESVDKEGRLENSIKLYEEAIQLAHAPLLGLEQDIKDPKWQHILSLNKTLGKDKLHALSSLTDQLIRAKRYSEALIRLKELIEVEDQTSIKPHLEAMMVCYFQIGQKNRIQQLYEEVKKSEHHSRALSTLYDALMIANEIPVLLREKFAINQVDARSYEDSKPSGAQASERDFALEKNDALIDAFIKRYGDSKALVALASAGGQTNPVNRVINKFTITAVIMIGLLALGNYIWADWYNIINRPGLDQIEFSQASIPTADPNRFSVIVANFENDDNDDHQRLLVEALKEYEGIQVLKLDREISLDGPIPEEMVDQGHIAARNYLKESGASMAIWGLVITIDGHSRPKLYWTTTEGDEIKSSFYFHENVFQLPDLFFDDLIQVLQLLVASREAEFNHTKGRFLDGHLLQLITKVNNLLTGSSENLDWDAKSKGTTLRILADALTLVGEKNNDPGRLQMAIETYHESLNFLTHDRFPADWAITQNNLAIALAMHGAISNDVKRFEEAVSAYQDALLVFTRERLPIGWARTQANLAGVLIRIGEREPGTQRLEQAVAIIRDALEEMTYARAPLGWTSVQFNLGTVLTRLGEKKRNDTQYLIEAVAAFENVLQEFTQELFPVFWAQTQNTMGVALTRLGEREDSVDHLERASVAFQAALKEVTRYRNSMEWARIQSNLGMAFLRLGEKGEAAEYVELSSTAFKGALEVFTRDATLLEWTITQNNLGTALVNLGNSLEHYEQAKAAFKNALSGFEALGIPTYVQMAQANLAEAQSLIDDPQE